MRAKLKGDQGGVAQVYARPHRDDWKLRAKQMLQGHLDCLGASGNLPDPQPGAVASGWKSLWRRSQKARLTGRGSSSSLSASSRQSRRYIRCLFTASTPEPEAGARCVSRARRDLCGGRGANLVPYRDHFGTDRGSCHPGDAANTINCASTTDFRRGNINITSDANAAPRMPRDVSRAAGCRPRCSACVKVEGASGCRCRALRLCPLTGGFRGLAQLHSPSR